MNDQNPHHKRIEELRMSGIVKRFPGVLAADNIDFDVRSGEIHALLGENGAGKSTLMKMLYGLYQPDAGTININGQPVAIKSPHDAISQGIGMIHQHFMLVPSLTVAENIALGMPSSKGFLTDTESVAERVRALSERYNLQVDPHVPIWQLAVGQQQRVEIVRALYRGGALLIMDEPTAVLTPQEVEDLFRVLRQLATDGLGIIFISHKLHEVLAISNRISVLRNGQKVGTIPVEGATKLKLAEMMVGRAVILSYDKAPVQRGEPRLVLEGVAALNDRAERGLNNMSFTLHSGEILGVAGVSGNGQQELAQVICGLRRTLEGTITADGTPITHWTPTQIQLKGISYVPEERMIDGVVKDFTVAENLVLQEHGRPPYTWAGIFMNFRKIAEDTKRAITDYEIKTPSHDTPIKNLSGGNIQKLVLARELGRTPRILIAAQPTRGVDIGATEYIHKRLLAERERGTAILLISEDLDEIRALSDRILVMYEGQVMGIVDNATTSLEQIGLMMAGTRLQEAQSAL